MKNPISTIWNSMDRWAIIRPTGLKILVILMEFFALFRQAWYWGSWLVTGEADPRAPFILHLGFFPDVMREYPFGVLLSTGKMPLQAWLFLTILSTLIQLYGYFGLPAEGLGYALKIKSRIGPALFYAGMVMRWGILIFLQVDLPAVLWLR